MRRQGDAWNTIRKKVEGAMRPPTVARVYGPPHVWTELDILDLGTAHLSW